MVLFLLAVYLALTPNNILFCTILLFRLGLFFSGRLLMIISITSTSTKMMVLSGRSSGVSPPFLRIGIDECGEGFQSFVTYREDGDGEVIDTHRDGKDETGNHTRKYLRDE